MSSPLDLAFDILMLQRGRYICPDTIAFFQIPPTLPYVCWDWIAFLFQSVVPESLGRILDLRELLLVHIDAHVHSQQAAEMSLAWAQISSMRRMVFEHIGHGLLASRLGGHAFAVPPTFHGVLTSMGRCMNAASHIRQYMDTPTAGFLGQCIALGESLAMLCEEHSQACRHACFSEGRGLVGRRPTLDPSPATAAVTSNYIDTGLLHMSAEPPGPSDACPQPYLFKEDHFEPLVEGHGQSSSFHPCGPVGEHAHLFGAGVGPWTRRQRQREDEQPAPVLVRDEGGPGGEHPPGRIENSDPVVGGRRGCSWSVVGSCQDTGLGGAWRMVGPIGPAQGADSGGSAVPRESPIAGASPWAPQGEWGGGGEAGCPCAPQVGRRRRREEDGGVAGPPRHVAWRDA